MEFRRFEGIINSRLDLFLFVEKEVNSSMNNFCIWNLFLGEGEGKKNWRGVLNYFDFVWGSSIGVSLEEYCFVTFEIFIFMAGIVESLTCSRTLPAVIPDPVVSTFSIYDNAYQIWKKIEEKLCPT